jgi:hypothetical protein
MKERQGLKEDWAAITFLFVLATLYFLPVLIKGNSQVLSSIGTDTWSQYFYWRYFGYTSIANGELPLWNPYIFSGTPYIAGIQSAIFYPLNLLYLLFATPFGINLNIAIHCLLASLFTYLFARYLDLGRMGSLLSALTFTYGAPYFFHIYPGHLSNLSTMVWLPLMLMGIEAFLRNREMKYAVLSGIPLSMQVFAGHPQYLFYSNIAVALYFFISLIARERPWEKLPYSVIGFFTFLITGTALSAVQLLPTLELTRHSVRDALTYEWVSIFSLPPEKLITLLVPDFFGNLLDVSYWGKNYLWEMSVYLGVIPFAIAVLAIIFDHSRHVLIFSFIAAASLILALGDHTPLLRFLYHFAPGFSMFRGLSKFTFVFAFAVSMLAGCGVKKLMTLAEEKKPELRYAAYALLGISLGLASLGILGWFYGHGFWRSLIETFSRSEDRYSPPPPLTEIFFNRSIRAALESIIKTSILLLSLGGLLFILGKARRLSLTVCMVSILALTAIDLWHFGSRYLVTYDPKVSYMDKELKAFLKSDKQPFRVATPIFPLLNVGLLEGIENVGGYDAIALKNYSEFINFAQGFPIDEPNTVMEIRGVSPMLGLLNVKYYILQPAMRIGLSTFELVFQNGRYKVYRDNGALPRSFIVHDAWIIKDREAIFRAMARPGFNPTSSAIIDEAIDSLPNNPNLQSPVPRVVEHSSRKVFIEADLKEPGLLVLGDVYYPGWKAFVDGKESRIYRANYVMRGVPLSRGRHTVEFHYSPLSFKIGAIVSLVAVAFFVGFLFWTRAREGR